MSNKFYFKRKEFAPMVSKFFPNRVQAFSEGKQNNFDSYFPLKCIDSI